VEITKETVGGLRHGHCVAGTTRKQLTTLDILLNKGVLIRAPGTTDPTPNTRPVWVGNSKVTADSNEGTGGMPLTPGSASFFPCERANDIYVVSTLDDQDLAWMAI
jgi:hypothetical protein